MRLILIQVLLGMGVLAHGSEASHNLMIEGPAPTQDVKVIEGLKIIDLQPALQAEKNAEGGKDVFVQIRGAYNRKDWQLFFQFEKGRYFLLKSEAGDSPQFELFLPIEATEGALEFFALGPFREMERSTYSWKALGLDEFKQSVPLKNLPMARRESEDEALEAPFSGRLSRFKTQEQKIEELEFSTRDLPVTVQLVQSSDGLKLSAVAVATGTYSGPEALSRDENVFLKEGRGKRPFKIHLDLAGEKNWVTFKRSGSKKPSQEKFMVQFLNFGQFQKKYLVDLKTGGAEKPTVKWYRPEIEGSDKKGINLLIISGQVPPGTKVQVPGDEVFGFDQKKKVINLKVKDVVKTPQPTVARENGYFEVRLEVPQNITAQVPVQVTNPMDESATRTYQLNFVVGDGEVKVTNLDGKQLGLAPAETSGDRYGFWLGLGFNYNSYVQNSSNGDFNFDTFTGPSFLIQNWMKFSDSMSTFFSLKSSPGRVASGDTEVKGGNYTWDILSGELEYSLKSLRSLTLLKRPLRIGFLGGIQYHRVPFLARKTAVEAEVEKNDLIMVTGGASARVGITKKWSFESLMRLQIPLISGDVFEIDPTVALDGSMGLVYKTNAHWQWGGFWYGQWQSYKFKADDPISGDFSGTQTLLYSNLEVRVGYTFH